MMRKIWLVFLLLLLTALLDGCKDPAQDAGQENPGNLIVVGFSQVGAESDWRNANTLSMQQALSTENGAAWIEDGRPVEQGKEAIEWMKLGYLL